MAAKTKKTLTGASLVALSNKRAEVELRDGDSLLGAVYIQKMSARAMHAILKNKTKEELEADDTTMFDFVAACVVDKDGAPILDREQVAALPSDVYGQLAIAVRNHLSLGEGAEQGKGSKGRPAKG